MQKIAFITSRGAPLLDVRVPYEKYRWGRAIAEVARQVDAKQIIQIAEGFLRDPETGEKTGLECLWGLAIRPDATIEASAKGVYEAKNGHVRVVSEIVAVDPALEEQQLIPAWSGPMSKCN